VKVVTWAILKSSARLYVSVRLALSGIRTDLGTSHWHSHEKQG